MIPREHRIRRLSCELSLADAAEALVVQQQVSNLCRTAIPAELDRVLSAFAGPELLVQIDRIELDLGRLHPDLLYELPGRIGSALREELLKRVFHEGPVAETSAGREGVSLPELLMLRGRVRGGEGEEEKGGTAVLSEQRGRWEAFRHFLRTGLLPWWAERDGFDLEETVFELIAGNREEAAELFREEVRAGTVRLRLIGQFSEVFLKEVAELLRPGGSGRVIERITGLLDEAGRAGLSGSALSELRLSLWQALLLIVSEQESFCQKKEVDEEALVLGLAVTATGQKEVLRFLRSAMERLSGEPGSGLTASSGGKEAEREQELHTAEDRREISDWQSPFQGENRSAEVEAWTGTEEVLFSPQEDKRLVSEEPTGQPEEPISFGIPVLNAGLVLLWPYLSAFFENCGLLKDRTFRDREAQERAVLLLQHLVSGEDSAPEYLLPLNKLLCGWALSETLEREQTITGEERKEAEDLLATVISHWQALKGTSPEGLRDAFLRRVGLLRKEEKGWLLQVERKGYDMLLDKLPWGISMIRLSWMKGALFVEW